MQQGNIRIVLVDDEPVLTDSLCSYLTRLGYVVTAFLDARPALDYFAANSLACAAIIVDLTLEGMSGEQFIRKVLRLKPDLAVLATSGYPAALQELIKSLGAQAATLQKPFTPQMLTDALDRLLTRRKAPG